MKPLSSYPWTPALAARLSEPLEQTAPNKLIEGLAIELLYKFPRDGTAWNTQRRSVTPLPAENTKSE